jgi:hypothetical protein
MSDSGGAQDEPEAANAGSEAWTGNAGSEAWTGFGVPPPPPPPLPGYPAAPVPRDRDKILAAAWGAAAVAILAGLLVFVFIQHLSSTAGVRVIVPAPAAAGGLKQDYTDEANPQFRASFSALRQQLATSVHGVSFTAAIYTNAPAGQPARNASFALVYLGFNTPSSTSSDPAEGVKEALAGVARSLSHVTLVPVGGGPGNASYLCETGATEQGSTVTVCGWATDRTAGLLVPQTPDVGVPALDALMKKMQPDLVRG